MHTITADEKEAMNLKESEWCMGGLRGERGRRQLKHNLKKTTTKAEEGKERQTGL